MTNDLLTGIPALLAGALLGGFFFGGLWWTIRKGTTTRYPALWFLSSAIIRTGVVLAGFYFLAMGDWKRMLACLLGFVAARFALLRLKPAEPKTTEP